MISTILAAFGTLLVVLLLAPLEERLAARVQARVGAKTGASGFFHEFAIFIKFFNQRNQTLPSGGKFWMVLWCSAVVAWVGMIPWEGKPDLMQAELALGVFPFLMLILSVCLHEASPHLIAGVIASLVPFVLSLLAVGWDAGGLSWAAVQGFDSNQRAGWRVVSSPSMALATGVFLLSGYASLGLVPLSSVRIRPEYKRGASGAVLRLGSKFLQFGLAAQASIIFFGGGGPWTAPSPPFILIVVLKSVAIVLVVQFFLSSSPKLRIDQWTRFGWGLLFFSGIAALALRGLGL